MGILQVSTHLIPNLIPISLAHIYNSPLCRLEGTQPLSDFYQFSYHLHSAASGGTIRKTLVLSSKGLGEGKVKEKQDGGRRVVKRGKCDGEK